MIIWLTLPRRPSHAYRGPLSQRSLCGCAPLLDKPAGEYPADGRIRRDTTPADPCCLCVLALERAARRNVAA
jgi:hypothetical protein